METKDVQAPALPTLVKDHLQMVAFKWATGERSLTRIALDLGLSVPYVVHLKNLPTFDSAVGVLLPDAKPVETTYENRLVDLKHDALDVIRHQLHHGVHERTRLRAAEILLNAGERKQLQSAATGAGGGGSVFHPGEIDRITETRIQTRTYTVGNRDGGQDGGSPSPAPEGLQRQSLLPSPGSSTLQGPSSTRTSPCLPTSSELFNSP